MVDGKRILLVEDEPEILELLEYNLTRDGYAVSPAVSGEQAVTKARAEHPDLILLDLMLPGMDGLEVCRALKREKDTEKIPIVMVTARGEEADIVTGLEMGADDYITKPFSPRVVLARVKAVLRRRRDADTRGEPETVVHEAIRLDPARHRCEVDGARVDLTATEFKVLHLLCKRPGRVYTRQQIVDAARGEDYAVTERAVDVQIVGLRKKLGDQAELIETVRGVGYRAREK